METSFASADGLQNGVKAPWFDQARFGMFVHYGLYSIHGKGEWLMFHEKIRPAEYNQLADRFTASSFDADALVSLAKEAGAGYVVFGARHHDGFCLWDSNTTDFTTVRTAAKRDLIREYVEACARAGLRVGIYYSVMSWQWPAIFSGPLADPEGWENMVQETHAQVRELMTDYGQIDYLWYDGCVVPGMGEASIRSKYWRSEELNAMVRELQPGILINDRAARPEDVTTPEPHLTPAPTGRIWECCQTIGQSWGWRPNVGQEKSAKRLIQDLVFCARFGGNYLLNIGPLADGSFRPSEVERLEAIGDWMRVNRQSVCDSERTPYTESEHLIGSVTCREHCLYFHLEEWPCERAVIAGIDVDVRSVELLGSDVKLDFDRSPDGCVRILGLPVDEPIRSLAVLKVELERTLSGSTPPSLLVEADTGRNLPAEGKVHNVDDWQMKRSQKLEFFVPARGVYDLDLGVISNVGQELDLHLDSDSSTTKLPIRFCNYPDTLHLKGKVLNGGVHHLAVSGEDADFGVYLWRAQPLWKMLTAENWSVVGPFPTEFRPQGEISQVRDALTAVHPPERGEIPVDWRACESQASDESVNFSHLCGTDDMGVCYARTYVTAPEACEISILMGCDWWANLIVNGRQVSSKRSEEECAQDGAWFNGWKPIEAKIELEPGENELLVKCHPGSADNWFVFYLNNPGDLVEHRWSTKD
ncbi:alpha-L-fucosidase [Puniceicoccus vermicola]